MDCLLRYFIRHGKSGKVYQDKTFNGVNLSIGRAADQALFLSDLRVALQHAVISQLKKDRFLIQSKSLFGIWINDRLAQSVVINVGDVVKIGNSLLKVVEPPKDFDLALEIEIMPIGKAVIPHKQQKKIKPPWWRSIRLMSWSLFLGILLFFLAIPMFSVYQEDLYAPHVERLAERFNVDTFEQELSLPFALSQRFWNTGPLSSSHHHIQQDCRVCHDEAFESVTDKNCISCHKETAPHVEPDYFDLPQLQETRCATCHAEHNGKYALVRKDDSLCSDCHKNLQEIVDTELKNASDFGSNHPRLQATLLRVNNENNAFSQERTDDDDEENFIETSNINFSHEYHLSREGLNTIDGIERLWCEDCHQREKGDEKMRPISYQKHCEQCHPLNFTPVDTERKVPHGRIEEILFTLEEYYGNRALVGGYVDFEGDDVPDVVARKRDEFDKDLSAEELHTAMLWAKTKARNMSEELFEFSSCIQCHKVQRIDETPPRWTVSPVRLSQNWYPKAYFTHERHKTTNCGTCHLAEESAESAEILIPSLETCQNCHAGIHSDNRLQSTCVDCHGFHIKSEFRMGNSDDDF